MRVPIYEYKCDDHGITEQYGHITDEQPGEIPCPSSGCGKPSRKIFPTTLRVSSFQPYWSEHLKVGGVEVTSQGHKRQLMKAAGVREVGNDHPLVHSRQWGKAPTMYSIPGVSPGESRATKTAQDR